MDECFEVATLIQTKKMNETPMVLVGSEYWGGLLEWMRRVMCGEQHNINPEELRLLKIFDTAEEVVNYLKDFYSVNRLLPNF